MNILGIRTAPRSPSQNAYVERVIGSIRRECLDHVIVANEAWLQRVIRTGRTVADARKIATRVTVSATIVARSIEHDAIRNGSRC
jgi:Integrase core domain